MITLAKLKDIAVRVKRQKETQGTGTVIFIGAGCSVSAGIPVCAEMLTVMEKDFNDLLENCQDKNYASYMDNLTPSERKNFLDNYIKNAKLNIAHVFLASLVKNGYVDCIVTTNFDNLALKALTTVNEFPAVYDLASSSGYISGMLNFPAVVYLHGQHTGMWQMNTGDEMDSVKKSIAEAFNEILANRTLIVVGYGGNDPVLDVLAKVPRFNHNAYWISYKDSGLPEKVEKIWDKDSKKSIYHLPGYDADKFFFDLHNELSIQPPDLFTLPFKYLEETYELISKDLKMDDKPYDLTGEARKQIIEAEKCVNKSKSGVSPTKNTEKQPVAKNLITRAIDSWLSWKNNDPDNLYEEAVLSDEKEAKKYLCSAFVVKGNYFSNQKNYIFSINSYEKAIKLNPENEIPYMNLGNSLAELGAIRNDQSLYNESFTNYQKAIKLNPLNGDVYNNWGSALSKLAEKNSDEALYEDAITKYETAYKLNPKDATTSDNIVGTFLKYSEYVSGKKKKDVLSKAKEKALINYQLYKKAYNLACTYSLLKDKENALKYLTESLDKKQIDTNHIQQDKDWENFKDDPDFIKILLEHNLNS